MTQYDNNKTSLWYKAGGQSQNIIHALVKETLSTMQKVDALKRLGVLAHKAVQVHAGTNGFYPRAYKTSATLWADPSLPDTFYIECPVDYKGRHYAPPGAVPLDDAQTTAVTRGLFHGGWGDSIPLTANFDLRTGMALPARFDPATHKTVDTDYFKGEGFINRRIYRADDNLYLAVRRYAASNNIDIDTSPSAIYGTDENAAPVPRIAGTARPAVWLFPEGLYFVYDGVGPGMAPNDPNMIAVSPAEYVWLRRNRDDRAIGIRPPEPPRALNHLYERDVFLAGGVSHALLAHDYAAQTAVYKNIRALKDKVFGPSRPSAAFKMASATIEYYGQRPQEEWLKDGTGTFKGFRFDWAPLNTPGHIRYNIQALPVPPHWVAVAGHPGVYLPDPAHLPQEAAAVRGFTLPPLQRRPQICGTRPTIVIRNQTTRFPRAEQDWPVVHTDFMTRGQSVYYIEPVRDYKGRMIRPDGAEPLSARQWRDFRMSLGDMYEPDWVPSKSVPVPADFKPKTTHKKSPLVYFALKGDALEAYRLFEDIKAQASRRYTAFMKKLGDYNWSGHDGKTLVYVNFKTPPGIGWARADHGEKGDYKPDPSTPEGLQIIKDFAALRANPDHGVLHSLLYPGQSATLQPYLYQLAVPDDVVVVAYKQGTVTVPPKDALPMDPDMFDWLQQESYSLRSDRPGLPAPQAIAAFLQKLKTPAPPPARQNTPGPV